MNPNTGAIAAFENEDDAKKAGFTIPLSDEEAAAFLRMPREQRVKARIDTLGARLKQIEQAKTMTLAEKAHERNLAIEAEFDRMAQEEAEKGG